MQLDPRSLSRTYEVLRATPDDLEAIYALACGNPAYFAAMSSPATRDIIRDDMTALPPGKTSDDKYYLVYWCGERPIAVLDLILGYPDAATAWIGFLMLDASVQGQGVGTGIVCELLEAMRRLGFAFAGLGYVLANAGARRFWARAGFVPTGEVRDCEAYTVAKAKRALR